MYDIFAKLLKKNNVTPYQISKATGIAQTTLSAWKNGRSTPKIDKLQKIAEYFGVSVDYLMGNEAPEKYRDAIEDAKVALFGGSGEVTEEMWEEVKNFARWVKDKNGKT